ALESMLMRQERMLDDLNAEVLRLNRLFERLEGRFEAHEARQENTLLLRPLSEDPPPPHY
ncbi:MAG: SlyX family protein, partial [Kiritimatiellae bacterium]|nr:SlyX family protein [Kiritimatiellia bacterium]